MNVLSAASSPGVYCDELGPSSSNAADKKVATWTFTVFKVEKKNVGRFRLDSDREKKMISTAEHRSCSLSGAEDTVFWGGVWEKGEPGRAKEEIIEFKMSSGTVLFLRRDLR